MKKLKSRVILLNILHSKYISVVNTLIKKLIVAWDSNYTKVTAKEKRLLEEIDTEMNRGEYISEEDIWK